MRRFKGGCEWLLRFTELTFQVSPTADMSTHSTLNMLHTCALIGTGKYHFMDPSD